uniref:Uncharacterized protein n=1 Tax=Leersia perrieri TaxID=77586 RepID=A0A0D9VY53_9ORYZ
MVNAKMPTLDLSTLSGRNVLGDVINLSAAEVILMHTSRCIIDVVDAFKQNIEAEGLQHKYGGI